MDNDLSAIELARILADLAARTSERDTAARLLALTHRLLGAAGLPSESPTADQVGKFDCVG